MITIACVWEKSEVYDSVTWIQRLHSMVDRRIGLVHRPYRFVCITTEPLLVKKSCPEVEVVSPSFSSKNKGCCGWWRKLDLFFLEAEKVLYFDLDTVLLDSIVPLIEFPSDFCVAPSSGVPMKGHDFNSSVMLFEPKSPTVQFIKDDLSRRGSPCGRFPGDQQYLSSLPIRADLFPSRWIRKYKVKTETDRPSEGTIVSLLIQGGKNKALIEKGHSWISEYWR